jgi:hypothetical protein
MGIVQMDLITLPRDIGATIEVTTHDPGLRRLVEARGFVIAMAIPGRYTMRRDFSDGMLVTLGSSSICDNPIQGAGQC